jgi:hypothetical protein
MENKNHNHYIATANATVSIETYGTEKGAERELKKNLKVINAVAKALGVELWIDEILVEE